MTDTNPAKFKKLVNLLKELFQLDQPDLDFGIYRIMHAKAGEVTDFLERDLLPQVKQAFAQYQSADSAELKKKLDQMVAQLTEAGVDPASAPKVKELREQLKGAVDIGALENETYDHLFSFFRRYYSEGDFLAKRVYKPGVYAIPYEGEEVTLHWANKDQYYIKTSEYLRDYAFRLRPEAGAGHDQMRVHFRLVDAAEGEHGNIKAAEGSNRVFVLAAQDFIALEDGELSLRFEYRPATLQDWPIDEREGKKKPPAQKELTTLAVKQIFSLAHAAGEGRGEGALATYLTELARPHIKTDGEQADYTRLEAHLRRYSARNTFDYFIHKDLGGFLRRELDFYIKNEVMHLDDMESETAPKVEQYLSKIRVIRRIAGKIIDFLAQLENFQKKLWLKKKFVTESTWLVALSQVPDELLPEVCANAAQLEEWKQLHALHELPGDVTRPAYSEPLTPAYLRAHPSLMVDTRWFDTEFSARLLAGFEDADACTDGVLVHSENFQALGVMQARYRERVKCIYIDPPYNTGGDGFAYRDSYQHSSWLAMMQGRLARGRMLLSLDGSIFASIDDNEQARLRTVMEEVFGADNFLANVIWEKKYTRANDARWFSDNHDFLVAWAKSRDWFRIGLLTRSEEQTAAYGNPDDHRKGPWKSTPLNAKSGSNSNFEYRFKNGVVWSPPPGTFARFSRDTLAELDAADEIWFGVDGKSTPSRKSFLSEVKDGVTPVTIWPHEEAGHNHEAASELKALFPDNPFANPKPCRLMRRVASVARVGEGSRVLDFFAGSGTTGHAAINLNREDGGQRKFILVEQNHYFDTVLVPRLKKVTFTPDWKDGKPKRLATPEEADRSPRLIKVLRLESYEDTLNNLELSRSTKQQEAIDFSAAKGDDGLREQYLLRYQLDVESKGRQSLLNISAFTDPTAYTLKVKPPGSDEGRTVNVDLLETFNWLLGLTVQQIAAPRRFSAEFERDSEGRLRLNGRLKQVKSGPLPGPQAGEGEKQWWFRTVTGTTPEGRKTLVIWRQLTGEPEQDNLVLEEWFKNKQAYSVRDTEFDLIYVNGDNTLENLRVDPETWKVRLIEEDFQRLMFEGTEN